MKGLSARTQTFTESVIREMTRLCNAAGGLNLAQGFPDSQEGRMAKDRLKKWKKGK